MKQSSPPEPPDELPGEVVTARRSGISWAWLFPLLALVATGWLYWTNWKAKGPEITISFTTAPGIEPGKTALIYRGVRAGTVRTNSRFWVMSATGVSASPGSVRLDLPALQGLLDGSIAFDHFGPPGGDVRNGAEFELSPDEFAARAEGPPVSIAFEDGAGLRAGETRVTCLGQPVGLVERITPDPASRRVEVVARLTAAFAPLATADAVFTIIRPSISLKGVQGLDTLVTGPHIAFEPGQAKEPSARFVGRELRQLDFDFAIADLVEDGRQVVLWSQDLPSLQTGAPLYHHGMIAGRVIEHRIGDQGRPEIVALVAGKFRDLLRVNTRFWRVPAALVAVGHGVIGVEMQSLSGLLQGGVAFDTFGTPGPGAPEHPAFEIYVSEQSASAISEPIRISFHDGQGLQAGKTDLRYLGIAVGIVEQVRVMEGKVEATARFQPSYEFLRRTGSEFAIIRPEIDLKGVHGLDTLVGGVYITCAPGTGGGYASSFTAVPPAEPALMNETGFEIALESPSTKIDEGAPISYNDTPVGEVISKTLSRDGKRIFLTARIRDAHSNLVKSNSVFWEAATVEAKVGIFKVEIDTPSVAAPAGRVAFHTPDGGGSPVKAGTVFTLSTKPPAPTSDAKATPRPFGRRN